MPGPKVGWGLPWLAEQGGRAEAGRWDQAVITAGEARDLAALNGTARLASDIAGRLALYRRREAYRDVDRYQAIP
jgi:hypothetical protein